MKKAIAIILCAVMLLPAFSFASFAEATITTWDQFAEEYDNFPITQVNATATKPTVDGTISTGEYTTTFPLHNYLTDQRAGATDVPEYVNMYINEDAKYIYIGVTYEYAGASNTLTVTNTDFRFLFSPASEKIGSNFSCYNGGSPKQYGMRYVNGVATPWGTWYGDGTTYAATNTENDITLEFTLDKSTLLVQTNFFDEEMTALQFGAWFNTYSANTARHGYGYAITQEMVDNTPLTKVNDASSGWDDSYLYFKLDPDFAPAKPYAWEDFVEKGLPFTAVSPVSSAPVIDANIGEDEYSTKIDISKNVTLAATAVNSNSIDYAASLETIKNSGLLPDTFDVYIASDNKNIYIGMKIETTSGFDGSDIRFVSEFTDKKYANYKPMSVLRNIEVGTASLEADGLSSMSSPNYKFGYNKPLTTIDGAVEGGYYTVEFILDKQLVKREWSLTGDIRYMNFGIWMWGFDYNSTVYRVSYGIDDTLKATIGNIAVNSVASTPKYDLDDAIITAKFLDADDTPDPVNTLNLSKWGQQTFYANQKTTVANDYTDGIKDGEYALEYTYKNLGSASQMGSIAGNGTQAGDYFTFFVDYDDDYVYLAFKAHEDTLVPRYGTIAGTYDENQGQYDNFNLYLGFNNDGTALNASKQIVLQCIPQVETNGKLGFRCNVKTQRGGADAIFDGVTGVWSLMNDNFRVFTGNWDAENKVLSYEIRLSKAEIAKAYGLEEISNVFTLAMCHDGQYFKDKAGTVVGFVEGTDQTGTGGGTVSITSGNGIKFWTNYWDGDKYDDGGADTSDNPGTHAPHTELAALFPAEYEGETKVTYSYGSGSGLGFGHNVVMGSSFVAGKPINTSDSASVRFTEGTTGMRFKSTVSKSAYDAIVEKYDRVYVGTVITPAEYVEYLTARGAKFTKADLDELAFGNENGNYLDLKTTAPLITGTDTYTFVGSIANIVDYTREFAAIGYIAYTDGEGVEHIIYSDTYAVRSVKQVAELVLNDFTTDNSGACGYTVANTEIITGKTVYTPYSNAQRTIAEGFAA